MSIYNLTQEEIDLVYGKFPDRPTTNPTKITLTDDTQIKEILARAGRASALEPRPELPSPMRYRVYWGDEKFFYLVTRYYGYPNQIDNGYIATLILRQGCSVRDAHAMFMQEAKEGASGPDVLNLIEQVKSAQN